MSYALVTSDSAQSGDANSVTTGGKNTTGSSLLVIMVAGLTGKTPTISDSKGNSWSPLTGQDTISAGGNGKGQLYYSIPISVGASHTFTASQTGSFPSIFVLAFSGGATSGVFDVQTGAVGNAVGTLAGGTITPGSNNEVVISGNQTSLNAPTVDSGFTLQESASTLGGLAFGGGIAYKIQTTATAVNPTWTLSGSGGNAAVCNASFIVLSATPVDQMSWRGTYPDVLLDTSVECVASGFIPRAPANPTDPTPT